MLTFLRKFRQSLIESGTARKYLFYTIGEIALVVIGILIALQINNWNENRVNKRLEIELLTNLLGDVNIDIQNLSYQDSVLSTAFLAKVKILEYSKENNLTNDSVFYYLSKTGPTTTFVPSTITYDEMKNANLFKIIKSREIRREISILYKQYETVEKHEMIYIDSQSRVRNIRIEDFATSSLRMISLGNIQYPEQVLNQVKSNRRFINALTSNYLRNMKVIYEETLQKSQNFKVKLEEYLKMIK